MCPTCMVQMYQHNKIGGGTANDSEYTTWTLQACPTCNRLCVEHYTAVVVSSAKEGKEVAEKIGARQSQVVVQETGVVVTDRPFKKTASFWKGVADLRAKEATPEAEAVSHLLHTISESRVGMTKARLWAEVLAFCAYWTEREHSGRREKWQLQKTFEVDKRLATWIRKAGGTMHEKTRESKYVAGRV